MRNKNGLAAIIILLIAFVIIVFIIIQLSPRHQTKEVVKDFYEYEQAGEYAKSWSLFHSQMKQKFTKGHYIQDRSHVFMNHFGVTSFTFSLSRVKKQSNWRMDEDTEAFDTVYKVTVTQTFKGKYGNFNLVQPVFVTKEENKWRVIWNYKN